MKTTTAFVVLALTVISGTTLVGCSTGPDQGEPLSISIEPGTYDHVYTFGDDLGRRLVVDNQGNIGHSTYSCEGDESTLVQQQVGAIKGDQIVFKEPDGSERSRADLWQAHVADPETGEADLEKPISLFTIGGTTFTPAHHDTPCK